MCPENVFSSFSKQCWLSSFTWLEVGTDCVWHWNILSDSTSDVNRNSEHRTRLSGPSSKIERNAHVWLWSQCHPEIEPTPAWRASQQYTGPRGRSTSWSRWRLQWPAAHRQGRSHRRTRGRGCYGFLLSGFWWTCTSADSRDTPSDQEEA